MHIRIHVQLCCNVKCRFIMDLFGDRSVTDLLSVLSIDKIVCIVCKYVHAYVYVCTSLIIITGTPAMVPGVTVDNNTININGNNVTLTLSWGEPFNNLDPIVNYTVSCSGDVTCPPNFTTTDNTTRSYTITNLTPMTNYTFSVVATNSIGSGEAGVVLITTPGRVIPTMNVHTSYMYITVHVYECIAECLFVYVNSYHISVVLVLATIGN